MRYHDPHVPEFAHNGYSLHSEADVNLAVQSAGCVVVVTDHSAYDWAAIGRTALCVVDTRNQLSRFQNGTKMAQEGLQVA